MAKKKILVIDDEEIFGQMVKLNLEGAGDYEVKVESKGENAIIAAKEFKPDMIFLDIIMPEIDGSEIAQQLRSDKSLDVIPVVFLTAMVKESEASSRKNIIIAGQPYPCLAKPVSLERLLDCINRIIP